MQNSSLKKASFAYLLLPIILFLCGWLSLPIAITSIAVILIIFLDTLSISIHTSLSWELDKKQKKIIIDRSFFSSSLLLAVGIIIIWMGFSGAGGVGFQNDDHNASNALLKDLITQDWPLKSTFGNSQVYIVYYIAYYLPAAFIGKLLGWEWANATLFIWTLIGVLLAFAWFINLSGVQNNKRTGKFVHIALLFCLAGGLDFIGFYILKDHIFSFSTHVEFWADYFQYSGNSTLIYWVPQHTIAAWIITGFVVDAIINKQNLKYIGLIVSTGLLWAPFGIIGLTPFIFALLVSYLQPKYHRYLFNWKSILFNGLSIGIGSLCLLYLGSNQFDFPMGFIWEFSDDYFSLAKKYFAFCFLEFAFLGSLLLLLLVLGIFFSRRSQFTNSWRNKDSILNREFEITPTELSLFVLCMFVLSILPMFKMGINNDLVMRGSIPSLFIFWAFTARVVLNVSFRVRWKFDLVYVLIVMTIIFGFFSSIAEIARSVKSYHAGPPDYSKVSTTLEVNEMEYNFQRIGSEDTLFFKYLIR